LVSFLEYRYQINTNFTKMLTAESLYILGAFACSFILTYLVMPSIIDLAYKKKLFDVPDERKVHTRQIPSIGGIGIFIGVLITFTVFSSQSIFSEYKYILTAYLLLFFMGVKDDLVPMKALPKLFLQILAAAILAFGGIRIESLFGMFGIEELNIYVSYIFTIFFIVGVTNAFNLIDGIDGLAGGLGGINCISLGSLLLWLNDYNYAILAFAITGSLFAFLRYNFGKFPNKTFMGDAGSLLLGLTVTILAIQFMSSPIAEERLSIVSPFAIVMGIIAIPVFDTLRVFSLRISKGQSPFSPDKNHVHHELLSSGLSHKNASIVLYVGNLILICNVLFFKSETATNLILLTVIAGAIFIHTLFIWRFRFRKKEVNKLQKELQILEEENQLI